MRKWKWVLAGLFVGTQVACIDACDPPAEEPDSVEYSAVLGAECRLVAQGTFAIALDETGQRFVVGRGLGREGTTLADVLPLLSTDGGTTYRPLVAHFEDTNGNRQVRDLGATTPVVTRGIAFDDDHIALVTGPPSSEYRGTSATPELDWLAISTDGGEHFDFQVAEFGSFPLGEDMWANRRWDVGSYVVASDTERYFISRDGGTTFSEHFFAQSSFEDIYDATQAPIFEPGESPEFFSQWSNGSGLTYQTAPPLESGDYAGMIGLRRLGDDGDDDSFLIDFGDFPATRLVAVVGHPSPGVIRLIAEQESATHDAPKRYLCDVGQSLSPSLQKLESPKPLAHIPPGELAPFSRFNTNIESAIDNVQWLRVTPTHKAYVSTEFAIASGDFHAAVTPFAITSEERQRISGLESPLWPTETSLSMLYRNDSGRRGIQAYDTLQGTMKDGDIMASFRDLPSGGATAFGKATSAMNIHLLNRGAGATELRHRGGTPPIQQAQTFPNNAYLNGGWVLQVAATNATSADQQTYMHVSQALTGRLADPLQCRDDEMREGCAIYRDGPTPAVVLHDRQGRIFALDKLGRRLLRHRADEAPDSWEVIVDGLHHPRDFELVSVDGRTFALILDGQVLAIDVDSPGPITRSLR